MSGPECGSNLFIQNVKGIGLQCSVTYYDVRIRFQCVRFVG